MTFTPDEERLIEMVVAHAVEDMHAYVWRHVILRLPAQRRDEVSREMRRRVAEALTKETP